MEKRTETLAWVVLLTSFLTCVSLTVGIPLSVRWYAHNATRPLIVVLQQRNSTVTVQARTGDAPILIADSSEIDIGSRVGLAPDADALLLFYAPNDTETPVVTAQLYGETDLTIDSARTPRYGVSTLPNQVTLHVNTGRNVRFTVGGEDVVTRLRVNTPQGPLDLANGIYALTVSSAVTELSVRTGEAHISDPATDQPITLTALQHTYLNAQGLGEIGMGERDMLQNRNGGFAQPLEGTWTVYTDTASIDEDGGTVRLAGEGERRRVIFERFGQGHAETGITQVLNQDIRGAQTTLRIRARLQINLQTLSSCGSVGTECPLMLLITYTDQQGNSHEWLQGFYAQADEAVIDFCAICEWKAQHIQVPLGVWYDYESPDLIAVLRETGSEPATIEKISVYASGHAYSAALQEIAILVGQ